MKRLNIPMPDYVKVSVFRPGYKEDVSALVEVTRDIVKERLKGDAWIMWAIAQRASLPVKIEACITKGISYYRRVLTGTMPGFGRILLHRCLMEVHKDTIKCWNFKGEVLNTEEFKQLMLNLVQDVSQFVSLVTAASAPIAPPVAILGLTYIFLQWLSTTALENMYVSLPILAYTMDLVHVLRELFDFTLKPTLALTTTGEELRETFEAYERSSSRQRTHNIICSKCRRVNKF
ncbi:hypothetical protein D9756_006944 [Leucocoprinus leucothites]|uniref:Uncharacterized protein n=1 Tax=Leucocoprinus leucothites TaxID=201217 RepID=A0A8H5D869_9AGAR|nr:hypothetical protein D9756_006944 [Leucoagaricus leucothites]